MAEILINGSRVVKGALSVRRVLDAAEGVAKLIVGGQLSTHLYFDEITKIETDRLTLEGVSVFQEDFGSENHEIIYTFTAASLELTGGESHLPKSEIEKLERVLYGGESNDNTKQ